MFWLVANGLVPLCVASALQAADVNFAFDVAQSKVAFILNDVLHTVRGTFRLKEGHLVFDPEKQTISGNIVVDAASGASGNAIRDRRMIHEILEAARYPEIGFAPMKIAGSAPAAGNSDIQVSGEFAIHGQTHDITLPMHIRISQNDLTATAKFTVPYVKWGMKNPSTFLLKVSDKVEIELTAVAHVTKLPFP